LIDEQQKFEVQGKMTKNEDFLNKSYQEKLDDINRLISQLEEMKRSIPKMDEQSTK